MKTEDILNIDCREEEGKQTLNKFLWKIKPFSKLGIPKGSILKSEDIEKILHGISLKYGYRFWQISPYYEDNKEFIFFKGDVIRIEEEARKWIGTVYGVTMWELLAKALIKIYGDIRRRKANE